MANAAPAVKLADAALAQTKKATRAAFGATLAELADAGVPVVAVDADLTGSTTTAAILPGCWPNRRVTDSRLL